ncbi:putative lipoprotein [Myxococcus xanthus DK 1622]|uniref:Lipoprotein n=3 Tax=Myxococcaceae TaxID=31 RepID=Q1DCT9_MYXXD|nr:putative lipoprotein [Myxococcus xanthus DK 1622]NOJ58006.1 hypothetical protein [Myxococcus xanthus]QPM80920.1 hypothetical protein I5Q59_06365 [Myxococcus xanthus]QVW69980.1 hypothetical protein JTM82_10655 [Myxococcus xanthus DZ2]UEO03891.1 hypothetical protein K1515_32155 [Myxococcus xanthus DZ2]
MTMARLLLVSLLVLCACTTLRGRADSLAQKGMFVEAAAIYDDLIRQSPYDQELLLAREGLRSRALAQLLSNAREARLEGDDEEAEAWLLRFLNHRTAWNAKLNGGLESSLHEEVDGTRRHLQRLVGNPARQGHALTAEQALRRKQPLLAHRELALISRDMEWLVLQSGKTSCQRLRDTSTDDSPHWRELVFRYCGHWREYAPRPATAPELFGPPSWTGTVEGLDEAQQAQLEARLTQAFESSPWFAPGGSARPVFSLEGRFVTQRDSHPVELTAPWTESVPYTDHEDRTETIEEPYEAEEEYTDSKGKTKTRKVTKYTKHTHTYSVPVTRYRDVPRKFEYHALRLSQAHHVTVASSVVLDARRGPFTVTLQDQLSESGHEHDVTFKEGNVRPQRPNFTLAEAWLEAKVEALRVAFSRRLAEHWRESYCSTPSLTLDEAARCARAGIAVPIQASRVLSDILGADATQVPALFALP